MSTMIEDVLKTQPLPADQIPHDLSLILPEGMYLRSVRNKLLQSDPLQDATTSGKRRYLIQKKQILL